MDTLPFELLQTILHALRPDDLVRCRAVCQRWRAAVREIEDRDRAFAYPCGAYALARAGRANTQVPDELQRLCDDAVRHLCERTHYGHFDGNLALLFPCACGLPSTYTLAELFDGPRYRYLETPSLPPQPRTHAHYAARHGGSVPPDQWERLARDYQRAQQMTDLCGAVDGRFFLKGFSYNRFQPPWFPYFLCLSDNTLVADKRLARVRSEDDLRALLHSVPSNVHVGLDGPRFIVGSYGSPYSSFDDEIERFRNRLQSKCDDWAGHSAEYGDDAVPSFIRNYKMYYHYGDVEPYTKITTAEEMTRTLTQQRDAFDAMVTGVLRLVRYPIVLHHRREEGYTAIVGLSQNNNLVGSHTTQSYR